MNAFTRKAGLTAGLQLLTENAATFQEFDKQINWLIADLEKIRGQAKTKFTAATR